MPKTIKYGIFFNREVEVDDEGFIEIPVIVQESGLYAGAPPAELRIHSTGAFGDDEFNKQYTAKLNRRTDLPFYLATAKVKIVSELTKITDDDLKELGIEPLPETPPQP